MASPDSSFIEKLGEAYSFWVDHHPAPDEVNIEFIGGPDGRKSYSPRQIANSIKEQTPFGLRRAQFYLDISTNLGDPTGEKVIQEFLDVEQWQK